MVPFSNTTLLHTKFIGMVLGTVLKRIKHFGDDSSLHGVKYVLNSKRGPWIQRYCSSGKIIDWTLFFNLKQIDVVYINYFLWIRHAIHSNQRDSIVRKWCYILHTWDDISSLGYRFSRSDRVRSFRPCETGRLLRGVSKTVSLLVQCLNWPLRVFPPNDRN
jgi:hypothetical protein